MAARRARRWLSMDVLEDRLTMSHTPIPVSSTTASTIATLTQFAKAYLSHVGQPNYNAAFDQNHNGQIGQDDAKFLLRELPAVARKIPITLNLTLAPQDKAKGSVPTNLGVTRTARPRRSLATHRRGP